MAGRSLAGAALAVVVLIAGPARAESADARARRLFKQAEHHFSLRELDKALELYREAYRIKPLPGFLFNIGQCERLLGRVPEALFSFKRYLDHLPAAPNRAEVRRLIEELERRAEHPPPVARSRPASSPAATAPTPSSPAPAPSSPAKPADVMRRRPRLAPIIVGAGLTAALLAGAIATGQLAHDRAADYRESTSPADWPALRESSERYRSASIACFAIGGALAIGTAVYTVVELRRARRPRIGASIAPSGVALTLAGEL